jgi:hypothetical protein
MEQDTGKQNFDVRQLSTWTPRRGDGSAVSLTAKQKRQLRLLPADGHATLLILSRKSCVAIALSVRPLCNFAYKYIIEPAFDDDEHNKPLTVDGMIDRMVRVIVANGVKPSSIVFEPVWNGIDGPQYRMLRIVQRAAGALGELLTVDVREIDLEMSDQMDRNLRSLAFVAKEEAGAFEPRAVRNALEIIADYSVEVLLQSEVYGDDPVAQAIYEEHLRLRKASLS